jgi:hypothetical protein
MSLLLLLLTLQPVSETLQSLVLFFVLGVKAPLRHVLQSCPSLIGLLKLLTSDLEVGLDLGAAEESAIQALEVVLASDIRQVKDS